ncbi:MAG: type III pantothenate kinase [Rhodobacteraceae bacterium]|nr:type III pantothenate kinase [Paracoccaceae bacterium]
MLLAIDVGNTNTVFALFRDDVQISSWRAATQASRTGDEYFAWLESMVSAKASINEINAVIVSSVVPKVRFNLLHLCERYFKCVPLEVGSKNCLLPIEIKVDQKSQVGADRIVNTVSAYDRYGGNLIVVDFGTATTFDVVGEDGSYLGGVIAPGVDLSIKALHQAAAALPRIDVAQPSQIVGKNTLECMQSGFFWGYISLIEGITKRIQTEQNKEMTLIGTGGYSLEFDQSPGLFAHVEMDLTIHGLRLIYDYNRKNTYG